MRVRVGEPRPVVRRVSPAQSVLASPRPGAPVVHVGARLGHVQQQRAQSERQQGVAPVAQQLAQWLRARKVRPEPAAHWSAIRADPAACYASHRRVVAVALHSGRAEQAAAEAGPETLVAPAVAVAASARGRQAVPEPAQGDCHVLVACQRPDGVDQRAGCPVSLALAAQAKEATKALRAQPDELRAIPAQAQPPCSDHAAKASPPLADPHSRGVQSGLNAPLTGLRRWRRGGLPDRSWLHNFNTWLRPGYQISTALLEPIHGKRGPRTVAQQALACAEASVSTFCAIDPATVSNTRSTTQT